MQLDETLRQANNQLEDLLFNGRILNKAAFGALCCLCLFLLFFALRKRIKQRWESTIYVFLCVGVLAWGACSLLADFLVSPNETKDALYVLRNIGIVLMPALLCLHVKQQVSYKELHTLPAVLLFVPPAVFILTIFRDALFPRLLSYLPALDDTLWFKFFFYGYAIVVLIRAYLLCFNVFYQMPKHMRRSTRYILLSITSFSLLLFLDVLWRNLLFSVAPNSEALVLLLPLAAPLAFCFMIYPLYSALHLMPSEDVIMTSREFVVGGLSTTILVLGRKTQILDWNRREWGDTYPLPRPLYKEPIDIYRKRILKQHSCRVSPHNNNIITALHGEEEMHFLLNTREVRTRKKRFGYLLEISEITPVYTLLRGFEEIAHIDQLTKLNNRNAYLHYVQHALVSENMPLLIFVGDVNGLKPLNDNHGHIAGDHLLKAVADIMQKAAPPDAFTARVGGDEYVMIVPRGTEEMADRFVRDVIALCTQTHHEVFGSPSISWGYALMTSTEQSYNEVFEIADAMMYAYKKGRNQFSSSGLMPEKATESDTDSDATKCEPSSIPST